MKLEWRNIWCHYWKELVLHFLQENIKSYLWEEGYYWVQIGRSRISRINRRLQWTGVQGSYSPNKIHSRDEWHWLAVQWHVPSYKELQSLLQTTWIRCRSSLWTVSRFPWNSWSDIQTQQSQLTEGKMEFLHRDPEYREREFEVCFCEVYNNVYSKMNSGNGSRCTLHGEIQHFETADEQYCLPIHSYLKTT